MYYEWAGLASSSAAPAAARIDVLEQSIAWLLGRRPPSVTLLEPPGGSVVTADALPIRYSIAVDAGRAISTRTLSYSLDGGESWTLLHSYAGVDSAYIWDLTGGQGGGGTPVPNSTRVLVQLTATDDGSPQLSEQDVVDAAFTLARPDGDRSGPVHVPGSLRAIPTPVRFTSPVTLQATFDDGARGASVVAAAEWSFGASPAAAGGGFSMNVNVPGTAAAASINVEPGTLPTGPVTLWFRARDAAGNWGPAGAHYVVVNEEQRTDVEGGDIPRVTFVAGASPNPFRGTTRLRFGLAQAGSVELDLFDVRGRHVRRLSSGRLGAGFHIVTWDGRDALGQRVSSGVFFARLTTASGTLTSRIVLLR
jgi:hypothetical protein